MSLWPRLVFCRGEAQGGWDGWVGQPWSSSRSAARPRRQLTGGMCRATGAAGVQADEVGPRPEEGEGLRTRG